MCGSVGARGGGVMWTNEAEKVGVGARQSILYHGSSGMNRFTLGYPEFRALWISVLSAKDVELGSCPLEPNP